MADGKRIRVERAPTYYGLLNLTIESRAAAGEIAVTIDMPSRQCPEALRIRLRHPQGRLMQSAMVNGKDWTNFDPTNEWIQIPSPGEKHYRVAVRY
jgi:hypothetical protein